MVTIYHFKLPKVASYDSFAHCLQGELKKWLSDRLSLCLPLTSVNTSYFFSVNVGNVIGVYTIKYIQQLQKHEVDSHDGWKPLHAVCINRPSFWVLINFINVWCRKYEGNFNKDIKSTGALKHWFHVTDSCWKMYFSAFCKEKWSNLEERYWIHSYNKEALNNGAKILIIAFYLVT